MYSLLRAALLIALLSLALPARAQLVVIVNAAAGVEQLSKAQVINIFLGRNREYSNGQSAMPLDLPASSPDKALFYRNLVNKDLEQMDAYWARLVFAGNTSPPRLALSALDAVQQVSVNPAAIAYVERKDVNSPRVRIVFSVGSLNN